MNVGIVVEGTDDVAVYPILIQRIEGRINHVHTRYCFGKYGLKTKFVNFLREFARNPAAFNLRNVLVIRDSDCNDPQPIERELNDILARANLDRNFNVSFHATKCKLESWLLADEQAISTVAISRGGRGGVPRIDEDLENTREADKIYRAVLTRAGLGDTDAVAKEIAHQLSLQRLAERCPRFRGFIEKVGRI